MGKAEGRGGYGRHAPRRVVRVIVLRVLLDAGQPTEQLVPFKVKDVGVAVLPLCVPWKPKLVDPPGGMVPL